MTMKNILIVDDEKLIRQGIAAMIKKMNTDFVCAYEAKNGKEALDILEAQDISLVITDINMPLMNGIELLKMIEESKHSPKTVILTAYEDFEYAREAIRYKVWAYLVKPVDRAELCAVITGIEKELEKEKGKNRNTKITDELLGGRAVPGVIEKALRYIEDNYSKDIDLAMVSNYVSLNYSYFSQVFKVSTGYNFVDMLKKVRVEQAKKMLAATDYKVYEIAAKCGFGDPKLFMKTFRAEVNISPRQFREALTKDGREKSDEE